MIALSKQVRNDSATIVARQDAREASLNFRQDALDQRERQIGVMAARVSDMAGRMAVEWDKLAKLKARADAAEELLALPPGSVSETTEPPGSAQNKDPEPSLELEDTGELPGPEPGTATTDQPEFPDPELPHPPVVKQPSAAGLDDGE